MVVDRLENLEKYENREIPENAVLDEVLVSYFKEPKS